MSNPNHSTIKRRWSAAEKAKLVRRHLEEVTAELSMEVLQLK